MVVQFRQAGHVYAEGKRALRGIDLAVGPGERVGLIGPSGSGKSTLLRCINGLVQPSEGKVETLGREVVGLAEGDLRLLRRQIGMIFQDIALIDRLSVQSNVLVGRLGYIGPVASLLRRFPKEDLDAVSTILNEVGLEGLEDRPVRKLSGGQRQRVGIARALVQQPKLLLGDEPTASLDVRTSKEVLELLNRLAESRDATLIVSLHDVRLAKEYCTRIVALKEGQLAWDGPAAQFGEPEIEKVFYS